MLARASRAPWDLVAVLVILIGITLVVTVFDLGEDFRTWVVESGVANETLIVLVLLAGALALLSLARWRALLREVRVRRLAEKALVESEGHYRGLVAAAPDAVVVHRDGRFVYANDAAARLLGAPSPEHLLHKPVLEIVHPDYRAIVAERIAAEQERREPAPMIEEKLVTLDGRVIDVEAAGIPFVYQGKPAGQTIIRDVTERRRAERELQEAEERFRALVEQVPAVTYTWEAARRPGTIPAPYVSPQIESVLGFSVEEWQGDPARWHEQVHPDDRARVLDAWARSVDTGAKFRAEYRIRAKDGREVWILDEAAMVSRLPDGRPGLYQGVMLDITDRKVAEQALAEAETRYRGLVEQVPAVVYIDAVDDLSTATYMSPRYEELVGYSAEERLAQPDLWVRLLHPDDRERVLAESRRTNETGEPFRMEYRLIHRDGRTVWVRDEAFLLRGAEGEPLAWQGVLLDVTEQKAAEELQARRDHLLEAVSDVAERFLQAAGWEEVILDALQRLGEAAGVSRVYVFEADTADDGARVTRQRFEWAASGVAPQIDNEQMREFRADELGFGDWLDTLAAGGVVQGHVPGMDEPVRSILEAQDIRSIAQVPVFAGTAWWGLIGFDDCELERDWTLAEIDVLRTAAGVLGAAIRRREVEQRRHEAEERYRALVEHIPAVLYIDRADEDMTGVYVSPQVEPLLDVPADEYLHHPDLWDRSIHPEDYEGVVRGIREGVRSHHPWSMEYRWVRPDGRIVWIRDEAVVLHDEEGHPAFVQGVMYDITERKLAEEALAESERREREAAARLRALDEMKNTFLAAVSHELRSPLTSILGLALTLEHHDLAEEDRVDLVRRLAANAQKLDRLLRDLLDIDRLNRGIVTPQYRVIDVGSLVRRTVDNLEQLRDRPVHLLVQPVRVPVDPAKVERIVENLVANAIRHTSERTNVWVRVEPFGDGALIAVEDDGPGVPDALRADIFQPFRQGPTASPHSPGTGIGLSLVARFAELHGGRAWVDDREGGGASFRVLLPGTPPAPAEDAAEANAFDRADAG